MNYHFQVHKEDTGFWAECCELDGCITQGETFEELQYNCAEALNLYLIEPDNSALILSLPDDSLTDRRELLQVAAEPKIAASVVLRNRQFAEKLLKQIDCIIQQDKTLQYA
ncbi:hypothetical protein FACS189427_07090 [Planctomycetales bacterium]|nr:hypothetical protein FACS189427_07090 [Planctomycetales bacterium]